MSLRERIRRAIHELTRPEGADQPSPTFSPPSPLGTSPLQRMRTQNPSAFPTPIHTGEDRFWSKTRRCCYCHKRLMPGYAPEKFTQITTSHIVCDVDGHISCGMCFLSPGIKLCFEIHD